MFGLAGEDSGEVLTQTEGVGRFADRCGRTYCGWFDGSRVTFEAEDGSRWDGVWIQGSGKVEGVPGGSPLSDRFEFTFWDYGGGGQRLNAEFCFAGTADEATAELGAAGYCVSRWDGRLNRGGGAGAEVHLRSRGKRSTGAGSGHAILKVHAEGGVPVRGELHVGEHNPTTGLGVGFLLHQMELGAGWWWLALVVVAGVCILLGFR